ncbi:MAG: hypothetical protein JWN61_1386, partial [Pseudonocardiales bacterium]|nr:hypothetical protein [Pseudonocardiales bacterium]
AVASGDAPVFASTATSTVVGPAGRGRTGRSITMVGVGSGLTRADSFASLQSPAAGAFKASPE